MMRKALIYPIVVGSGLGLAAIQMISDAAVDALTGHTGRHGLTVAAITVVYISIAGWLAFRSTRKIGRMEAQYQQRVDLFNQASHEIRTPLTAIVAYADILRETPPDESTTRQYLQIIADQACKLRELADDILAIGRLDREMTYLPRGEVDLGALLQGVMLELQPLAALSSVTLIPAVRRSVPVIFGEPAALRQMVVNLLENAIKYNRPGGKVYGRLRSIGDGLQLAIADTGLGIPTDSLPHVFEEFYRGRRADSAPVSGSGLGLAIVRRVAEAHGGHVRVESALGRGTAFFVYLPKGLRSEDRQQRRPLTHYRLPLLEGVFARAAMSRRPPNGGTEGNGKANV